MTMTTSRWATSSPGLVARACNAPNRLPRSARRPLSYSAMTYMTNFKSLMGSSVLGIRRSVQLGRAVQCGGCPSHRALCARPGPYGDAPHPSPPARPPEKGAGARGRNERAHEMSARSARPARAPKKKDGGVAAVARPLAPRHPHDLGAPTRSRREEVGHALVVLEVEREVGVGAQRRELGTARSGSSRARDPAGPARPPSPPTRPRPRPRADGPDGAAREADRGGRARGARARRARRAAPTAPAPTAPPRRRRVHKRRRWRCAVDCEHRAIARGLGLGFQRVERGRGAVAPRESPWGRLGGGATGALDNCGGGGRARPPAPRPDVAAAAAAAAAVAVAVVGRPEGCGGAAVGRRRAQWQRGARAARRQRRGRRRGGARGARSAPPRHAVQRGAPAVSS